MHFRGLLASVLFIFSMMVHLPAQTKTIAERLGYPPDSKLLILHADDLAVAHSADSASFAALDQGAVTSASIMVPCPWITEVAAYAKTHPDADLGLHLTLTSEWNTYRWGSVASAGKVPSLLKPDGTFWSDTAQVADHAKPQEAELEIRAQIDRATALGIHPTHLDSHMGSLFFTTPELFAVYVRVAHDYHLPFLAARIAGTTLPPSITEKDIVLDAVVMADPKVQPDQWKDFYLDAVKNLKPGLTEFIVHLGHDDAELQAITVDHPAYGAAWRQRDYDLVTSAEFKTALQQNHIVLLRWKDLQRLVQ